MAEANDILIGNRRSWLWCVRLRFQKITFKTVVASDTEIQAAYLAVQNLNEMFTADERAKLGPLPMAEILLIGKCDSCFA